ncbi:MAG TPA: hypothetical protein VIF64_08385, partial [Pyrinomonadaceae bacterium]
MRTTLSSIPFSNRLQYATVKLIDDISVRYLNNALARREDPASDLLRTGECESVINLESFSDAQEPANPTYQQDSPKH